MTPSYLKGFYILACTALIFLNSCSNSTEPIKPAKDIDELVRSAGELPVMPQELRKEVLDSEQETYTDNGQTWFSNSKKIRLSNKYDEIIALKTTSNDALYPGSIVQGQDIINGDLTPIGDFVREPITITINNAFKIVNNPSKATVEQAISELSKQASVSPANIEFSKTEIYSSQQAFAELGMSANWLVGSISGKFQKESGSKRNSILLYFKQIFYSATTASPSTPSDVFGPSVNIENLRLKITPGNPPCYIAQVNYGRVILVKMTSSETIDRMMAAINGSYKLINGKAEFEKSKLNFKCDFDALILGGSPEGAANAVTYSDIEDINQLIARESNYTSGIPAYPISYSVRYLSNNRPVKLGATVEYKEQKWMLDENAVQRFSVYLNRFDIIDDNRFFSDGEFFYKISITDANGLILKDANGQDALLETDAFSARKVGSGMPLAINHWFNNIAIAKQVGQRLHIKVELWDNDGEEKLAGLQDIKWDYPWGQIPTDYLTIPLVNGVEDYEAKFNFKVEKK